MSDDSRHTIDEELVTRHLSGETTSAENALLEDWCKKSAANQRQMDLWRVVWVDTGRLQDFKVVPRDEVEVALEKVRNRKNELLGEQASPTDLRWLWKVAAILVVGVGIGWFVFSTQQKEQREWVAEAGPVVSELEDGTVISLNQASRLEVTTVNDHQREVFLEGEAYFEVTPDPDRPFIVTTARIQVEVLGTSFNVSEAGRHATYVSVEEGRVRFSVGQQALELTAGQTASYDHLTEELALLEQEDTGEYRFWKTRKLVFRGQKLSEVAATLNRTYSQRIRLANEQIGECQLTVSFENETVENILEIITITLGLEVRAEGEEVIIDGEGC